MFYFAQTKKSNFPKEYLLIKEPSLKDAKEYVKAWIRINDPKKKSTDYKILTETEYKSLLAENKKKQRKALEIDDVAKNIWKNIFGGTLRYLTKTIISDLDLKGDTSKPYYIRYWNYSYEENYSKGKFVDTKELKEFLTNHINDDGLISAIYDAKTAKISDIEVKYEAKLFLKGKELV